MKMFYALGACLLMTGFAQADINLIDDDFAASSITTDTRLRLNHAGDGSGDDWKSRSDSLWNVSGGNLNNPGTIDGRESEGGMGQVYAVTTTDTTLTQIRFEFDYTVGTGSTLFFHAQGLTENGMPAGNEALSNMGAQNGNTQNQAEAAFADINIIDGTDADGVATNTVSFAGGMSGTYNATFDLAAYSWSADESPGVTGSLGNITSLEYLSLMFSSDVTDHTGAGAISIDNFKVDAIGGGGGVACDLDGDSDCDLDDIDLLYAAGSPADVATWLTQASAASNPAVTYVPGDVDLDGDVDSTDLGSLLNNFNSTSGVGWGGGDFDDDSNADSTDLGALLNNFNFTSAAASAVPEPTTASLLMLAFAGLLASIRRK